MDLSTKIARSDNFIHNVIDGELVMMNIETGSYVSMNNTGKIIWEQLENAKTVNEIISDLLNQFTIERSQCEADVIPFIEKMIEQSIVVVA
jgi:hypothetical protein